MGDVTRGVELLDFSTRSANKCVKAKALRANFLRAARTVVVKYDGAATHLDFWPFLGMPPTYSIL